MPDPLTPTFRSPRDPAHLTFPALAVGISGAVIALILGVLVVLSSRHHAVNPNQEQPISAYAHSLALSQLAMSESTSLSGGKSTFLDGHVMNRGTQIVSAITVQALFKNDEGMPPHLETLPLALIRTREPYVDTQPIAANPIHPGEDREFRLIFEAIPENWNTQLPELRVIGVTVR